MLRKDNHLLKDATQNMTLLFVSALIKANEVETH